MTGHNSHQPGHELISVIVPTYNQAGYLPITLDSIWFQSYPNIEIIIVDDASTDDTAQVLSRYLEAVSGETTSFASNYNERSGLVERTVHARYPQEGRTAVLLRHAANQGLSAALNTGFSRAGGRLCTFIASDDMLLPGMLAELKDALEAARADFAYADMHIVDDAGRILRRFALPDYSFETCFCRWYLLGVCKLYKKELHVRTGWYDPAIAPQDHDMYLRFAMHGAKFVHVPKVLANVRIHDGAREVHNHAPEAWSRLYGESAELVRKARRHAASDAKS